MGSKTRKAATPAATSVADALFSRTQQRLLSLLFVNPDRSYFANELVRLSGSGFGAMHRELAALEAAGLVTARRIGNQKHYRANRSAAIFEELRGIALKTFGVAEVLREALQGLAGRIRVAFVYGSLAKKADRATSDVDLMVVGDDLGYAEVFSAVEPAERRLGRKVNPTVYTGAELSKQRAAGDGFLPRVLGQPKIYVIGAEGDLREPAKARKRGRAQG
jgi:predicted nucleotidyltransferase